MHLFQVHLSLNLHRLLDSPFRKFELSIWLHVFARSLISIFIPIFLLLAGYSIGEVMIYYFIYNVIDVPFNFVARWLTRKIGARIVIILGSVFMLLYFISLSFLHTHSWAILIMIAFFAAIYDALYWVAHLYFFVKCSSHKNNISHDTSSMEIVKRVASIIAPAIGAGILLIFNQGALIFISAGVIVVSIIPLLKIKKANDRPARPQKTLKEFFSTPEITKDYFTTMFYGVHLAAENVIFPIFLFVLLSDIKSVAAVPVLAAFATMLFTYFAGSIKKENRSKSMALGALVVAIFWILRLVLQSSIFFYASIFVVGLFSVMISIPLVSTIFEKGERVDTLSASAYRNAASMFGKMLLFGLLAVMVNVFNVSFVSAALSLFLLISISYIFRTVKEKTLASSP